MKIYKYRSVDSTDAASCSRLAQIVRDQLVWCARPSTLDDPDEFVWTCDFTQSPATLGVLAGLLQKTRGHSSSEALRRAQFVLQSGAFDSLGRPVIEEMIENMRDGIGVACFGSTPDNPALWSRYAGEGTGVAVEIDVPDSSLGPQFHRVVYDDDRTIHIDDFIRSMDERGAARSGYVTMLTTKTRYWEPEEEIRFLSKRQQVEVRISDSIVTSVLLGPRATSATEAVVRQLAGSISVVRIAANSLRAACSRRHQVWS